MIPIIGYANKLSARPGDTLNFKISSTSKKPFEASLVRIRCSDANPNGPGVREKKIEASFSGQYKSRFQDIQIGSYGLVQLGQKLNNYKTFSISTNIWPTTPIYKRQAIISWGNSKKKHGILGINSSGKLFGEFGDTKIIHETALAIRTWYTIWISYNSETKLLSCGFAPIERNRLNTKVSILSVFCATPPNGLTGALCFGAEYGDPVFSHYNGKIENPKIHSEEINETNFESKNIKKYIANWDFSKNIPTTTLLDIGPNRLNGKLFNLPARAMTGSNWTGEEMNWNHKKSHYGAIHFHDDDIHDCGWETDFSFSIPKNLSSGIYAVKLNCDGAEDSIPFIICPPKGKKTADLCLIIPTFTYIVYANHARPNFSEAWQQRANEWNAYPHNPSNHKEYGLSTYNFHNDGSGICHSSALRPILTMRPGYFHFVDQRGSGLRHFQADTHIIDWLEEKEITYDLISDHEIHEEGITLLEPYNVILTSTHPEYHTRNTLDAIEKYQEQGGRFIYLGGNGFYWKVAMHVEETGVIEIRRGEGGIRAWAAEPGEYYNAFDGEYGGLWRRNGRPPQKIAGVGFSAQGTFIGSYYRRLPISLETRFNWVFDGIEDILIGDFGLSGGGAAGFELDRADFRLGTPNNAVILASSEGHNRDYTGNAEDFFVLVPEEQLTHLVTWPGEKIENLIRADIIFYQTSNGGAVFSVGSITFCGSLPNNNYKNNISKLLSNVIERFLEPNADFSE